MRSSTATITNVPVETHIPCYSEMITDIAPDAHDKIIELESLIHNLQNPEAITDKDVLNSLEDAKNEQVGWYRADLQRALDFIGYNSPVTKKLEPASNEESSTEFPSRTIGGAFAAFRRDFDSECQACGLTEDD